MNERESLYGLKNTNRKDDDLWGKNQFNSSFPASLACYMRDHKINPIYLYLDENLNVNAKEVPFDFIFNTTVKNENLTFLFESKYTPYQNYAYDDIRGIDLVIKEKDKFLRALEIKLTVVPDNTTYNDKESDWGSEIVIRPASTSYCALGIIDSCKNELPKIRNIFEKTCENIQHWGNQTEIFSKKVEILDCLNEFQSNFIDYQKPFLMQPIWKTKGKTPILDKNAFDIFIWSDFALCRTFIDRSSNGSSSSSRLMRSSARLTRILYEIASKNKTHIDRIYTDMNFGYQSDKEFALSGKVTRNYMNHPRRSKPILPPSILKEIILNGGQNKLSPERRFDQSVYYTAAHIFDEME
ncbi:HindVP family restriction endonuclease [Xenorhabdus bovienii]|uniref:HindVP family restriction endonuclease n=1 Tax=Xenorhabdus bovienii TaxID=40576 RepID=UPI0023B28431|nr:HindVP family restriction endonuclease [Xenorhabdus bovienii]MDE9447379.1 HindVP family restriction endonuclease [Xenorhabdus bovienii]